MELMANIAATTVLVCLVIAIFMYTSTTLGDVDNSVKNVDELKEGDKDGRRKLGQD